MNGISFAWNDYKNKDTVTLTATHDAAVYNWDVATVMHDNDPTRSEYHYEADLYDNIAGVDLVESVNGVRFSGWIGTLAEAHRKTGPTITGNVPPCHSSLTVMLGTPQRAFRATGFLDRLLVSYR